MRLLILGASGMLGHRMYKYLKKKHIVGATLRKEPKYYQKLDLFNPDYLYSKVDVREFKQIETILSTFNADAVINCVGITNKGTTAGDSIMNIEVNALFPHRLANYCAEKRIKMIHFSTDCVFSGRKGKYSEQDTADADDLYGRSKFLGEVDNASCLTLRTSIIGLELEKKKGLLEWFLSQGGSIQGYKNAIFSGVTTHEISRIVEKMLISWKSISGPVHVSSEPISKYDLLYTLKKELGLSINIIPDTEFKCNRSLNSTKFQKVFDYTPPSWATMLKELCKQIKRERL